MEQTKDPASLLLDACCLVNLLATRRANEILRALPRRFQVVDGVASEVGYVRRGGSCADADELDPVSLQPLIDDGLIDVLHLDDPAETGTYVDFADVLGNGEAMTLTIALHRGHAVVTDDRKAARIAGAHGVTVVATLELIKQWSEGVALDARELRQALIDLHERGRYLPARSHPLRLWWEHGIAEE